MCVDFSNFPLLIPFIFLKFYNIFTQNYNNFLSYFYTDFSKMSRKADFLSFFTNFFKKFFLNLFYFFVFILCIFLYWRPLIFSEIFTIFLHKIATIFHHIFMWFFKNVTSCPFVTIFTNFFKNFFTKKYIFLFYSVKYILYTMSKCSTQLNILKNFLCHFLLKNDLFFARFFQKMRSIFYRICGFSCACR